MHSKRNIQKKYFKHNFSSQKSHPLILDWFKDSHLLIEELCYDYNFYFIDEDKGQPINDKLVVFNKNNFLFLFVNQTKLSFKDETKKETLYELSFNSEHSFTPSLKIFRPSDTSAKLKLIHFSDNENTTRDNEITTFFKQSFSEIELKVVQQKKHFDLWIKDKRSHQVLLVFSSVDAINDLEVQLLHYLQIYITNSEDDVLYKKAIKKINGILKDLTLLPLENIIRSNIRKKVQFNDLLLHGLLNYKNIHRPLSHTVNNFIKDILDSHHSIVISDRIEIKDFKIESEKKVPPIPLLIDQVADEFCHKNELTTHFTFPNVFMELEIDQPDNHIDYNTAKLSFKTFHESHDNELIVGLKINDLGLGFPIVRLLIIGSKAAITPKECAKINAALKYASEHSLPIDWFSCSYGVDISMKSGVEGLDASSSTAREIIKASIHCSVPINIVIDSPNVGAQAYWDAIASILFETNGIIIMTDNGSMTLTGHKALTLALQSRLHSMDITDVADRFFPDGLKSMGGYKNIYGPSGEAMAVAENLKDACELLIKHHYYSYTNIIGKMVEPRTFSKSFDKTPDEETLKKEIKKIQSGYKADRYKILEFLRNPSSPAPLQWWREIETPEKPHLEHTIIEEMVIGKWPTMVIFTPTGPLSPVDAITIAKGIYKANGRMPVLIIGNLTGFNSDPEAMKNVQLFSGASIIKAIVDHKGPIVVANLGTLVGGTYVIFSKQLNPFLKIIAVEGAKFQVIGGVLASKLIFHKHLLNKAKNDPRLRDIKDKKVYEELLRKIIEELEIEETQAYDQYHSAQRALEVKSIDKIVQIKDLKQAIIETEEELIQQYSAYQKNVI